MPAPDRKSLVEACLADLRRDGVAMLQAPPGSGASTVAALVAAAWDGPSTRLRPTPWTHLADLVRPLWSEPPPSVLAGDPDELVETAVDALLQDGRLVVLDDADPAFADGGGGAVARDPDVDRALRRIVARAESRGPDGRGALLVVAARSLAALDQPVHPVPGLGEDEAAALAGRPVPSNWQRRPGLLRLVAALDGPLPEGPPGRAFGPLVQRLAEGLDALARRMLVAAAGPAPVPGPALAAAAGADPTLAGDALRRLEAAGLLRSEGGAWWCPAGVRGAVRTRVGDDAALDLRRAVASWCLANGQQDANAWRTVQDADLFRLGVHLALAADAGELATQALLYGGVAPHLERLNAPRLLHDDLGDLLAVAAPGARDASRAWFARGRLAARLGDPLGARRALEASLAVGEGGDARLAAETGERLAALALEDGRPEDARHRLREARVAAAPLRDRALTGRLQHRLGQALLDHDGAAAERELRAALEAARDGDDLAWIARCQADLAVARAEQGQLAAALADLSTLAPNPDPLGERAGARCALLLAAGRATDATELLRAWGSAPPALQARVAIASGRLGEAERALGETQGPELERLRARLDVIRGDFGPARDRLAQFCEDAPRGRAASLARLEREVAAAWRDAAVAHEATLWTPLLQRVGRAAALASSVPTAPWRPARERAMTLSVQVLLLAATVGEGSPLGALREVERWVASSRPDGLPTVVLGRRVLQAWATDLCGADATTLARTAARDAASAGLVSLSWLALAVGGDPLPDEAGQARTLARLLAERR